MNWLIGGAAVLLAGPWVLRKIAENPDTVRKSADLIETGRDKAVEYGKRGAKAATDAARRAYEERRASRQVGTFGGLLR
jgi:hypothetical protein